MTSSTSRSRCREIRWPWNDGDDGANDVKFTYRSTATHVPFLFDNFLLQEAVKLLYTAFLRCWERPCRPVRWRLGVGAVHGVGVSEIIPAPVRRYRTRPVVVSTVFLLMSIYTSVICDEWADGTRALSIR